MPPHLIIMDKVVLLGVIFKEWSVSVRHKWCPCLTIRNYKQVKSSLTLHVYVWCSIILNLYTDTNVVPLIFHSWYVNIKVSHKHSNSGVMVISMLDSSMLDCGFESRSDQAKDYTIDISSFSAKHTVLRS
jgi:hypothetical protein